MAWSFLPVRIATRKEGGQTSKGGGVRHDLLHTEEFSGSRRYWVSGGVLDEPDRVGPRRAGRQVRREAASVASMFSIDVPAWSPRFCPGRVVRQRHLNLPPMKILHLTHALYPESTGGVEVHTHQLANAQVEAGHQVLVASQFSGPVCLRDETAYQVHRLEALRPLRLGANPARQRFAGRPGNSKACSTRFGRTSSTCST